MSNRKSDEPFAIIAFLIFYVYLLERAGIFNLVIQSISA
jgi:hypothetical protein